MSDFIPEQPPETDPKAALRYRLALGSVIILSVLLLIGLGALIVGLLRGGGDTAAPPPPVAAAKPAKPASLTIAPGYKILSADTQPGRLILHIRSDTRDEIDIIDTQDGRLVARIHAAAPQ